MVLFLHCVPSMISSPRTTDLRPVRSLSVTAHNGLSPVRSFLFPSAVTGDELIRALVVACLEAARRLAPRRHRMASARCLAFTAAMRVVDRIHRYATVVRAFAHPALASGLAERNVLVVAVAHCPDGRHAVRRNAPDFSR